jgi:hypothetical protein
VPTALDEVAARALALPGRDGEAAYTAPAEIATALIAAIPPVAVPPAAARRDARRDGAYWPAEQRADHHRTQTRSVPGEQRTQSAPGSDEPFRPGRRGAGRAIALSLLLALAVAGASAAALHLLNRSPSPTSSTPPRKSTSTPASSPTQGAVITPASAQGFDALNPSDRGDENTNQAQNVLNGNSAGWSTQYYFTANFGSLKAGTGFILNLGTPQKVGSVTVTFGNVPGANVKILEGDSPARTKANLDQMTQVATGNNVSGTTTFTVTQPVTDQYLVIWFTKLPPMASDPSHFAAQIFSVVIHRTS